jgi:hypothetical protein
MATIELCLYTHMNHFHSLVIQSLFNKKIWDRKWKTWIYLQSCVLVREKGQDEQQIICTCKSNVSAMWFAVVNGLHVPYSKDEQQIICTSKSKWIAVCSGKGTTHAMFLSFSIPNFLWVVRLSQWWSWGLCSSVMWHHITNWRTPITQWYST